MDLSTLVFAVTALIFLAVIIFMFFTIHLFYVHHKYSHLPGPRRDSFYLGHIPSIVRERKKGIEINQLLLEWSKTHGPLYVFWSFHIPVIIAVSPEIIKELIVKCNLPKPARVYGNMQSVYGQRCIGRGLLTERDHQIWLAKRVMINPAFHRRYLMNLMPAFNAVCDRLIRKLSRVADGKTPVNMAAELTRTTLDAIGKVAFDVDLHAVQDINSPFPANIFSALHGIEKSFFDILSKINLFTYPYQWRVIKAIKFLRKSAEGFILKRKEEMERGEDTPQDILDHILTMVRKDPQHVDLDDLVDHVLTFFIAGQETTSNQLAFTLYELGKHPEIEQRNVEEIDRIIGHCQVVEYEDLGKLQYLGQTLKESLRLHPPIPHLSRSSPQEIKLAGGYVLPANSEFFISSFASHRDPDVWPDPDIFDPDRFSPSSEDGTITGSMYLPFSLGPRSCIGKTFAQIEAKVIMARLYQEFEITLVPGQRLLYELALTLRAKEGVWCTLKKRAMPNDDKERVMSDHE